MQPKVLIPFVFIVGLLVGFLLSKTILQSSPATSFYDSESAFINGQVLKVDKTSKTVTVKNKSGREETFPISDNVFISDPQKPAAELPSKNLDAIKLNEDAGIALSLVNGVFKVASISYGPPVLPPTNVSVPPNPQVASSSALPNPPGFSPPGLPPQ